MAYIPRSENGIGTRLQKLGFRTYNEYLKSEHWKQFKEKVFRSKMMKNGFSCWMCTNNNTRLNVHHKTYKNLGKEKIGDIMLICEKCHKFIHIIDRKLDLYQRTKIVNRIAGKKCYSYKLGITRSFFDSLSKKYHLFIGN